MAVLAVHWVFSMLEANGGEPFPAWAKVSGGPAGVRPIRAT